MHLSAIQWHQKLEFNQKYRQLFGISGRTASRELKILVEKGLIRRPEKKGAAYALE
jgi:DNA-binding HxlR family transcriptional regulator